jgi:hypothetical protein
VSCKCRRVQHIFLKWLVDWLSLSRPLSLSLYIFLLLSVCLPVVYSVLPGGICEYVVMCGLRQGHLRVYVSVRPISFTCSSGRLFVQ